LLHYRAILSFPHVFSGNPGKIKLMDARLMHSGMTNCAKFAVFKKVHGKEIFAAKTGEQVWQQPPIKIFPPLYSLADVLNCLP
jgi:hypothetical protein